MQQASKVQCRRCPLLCESRKSIVDGTGPLTARLMVVGDMPRREDDRAGNPFVGQDGHLLKSTIAEICARLGIESTGVYYTNAVRCRTPEQRPPSPEEIDNCMGWLYEEIDNVNPRVILAVGSVAQALVTELDYAVTPPHTVLTWHPAYLLKAKNKLPQWQQEIESAIRLAWELDESTKPIQSCGPIDWTLGMPDMQSPWLSADTEFDTLDDESHSIPVGYSLGDTERADFHAGVITDGLPHVYCHNIRADADHLGINIDDLDSWDDTQLMAYVTRKFKFVGLKKLAPELAGVDWPISIKELLREYQPSNAVFKSGPRKGQEKPGKWLAVPFSRALETRGDECRMYAATDALATARIAQSLSSLLDADDGWARRYYREFEKPLVPVLLSMERAGVRIDPDRLHDAEGVILAARARSESFLRDVFGQDTALASNQQMGPLLLEHGLIDGKLTESGELGCSKLNILGAFNAEKIEDLPDTEEGQIARNLLEWRQMGKLKSTYVDAILQRLDVDSRVHGRYNQAVTNTNRLSSSDPNLQNIPARSEIGLAIRKAFVPRDGCVFVGGDFSQLQLRVWAEFTRDDVFVKAYTEGGDRADFHGYAAQALGRPRNIIKNVVFAVLFGADEQKAAVTAGLPQSEIRPFMEQMKRDLPSLSTFKVAVSDTLAAKGYVESLQGWRGFFPDSISPVTKWRAAAIREAVNFPIQATEAGLVKAVMAAIYRKFRESYPAWQLVLQVHDEVWAEGPPEQAAEVEQMMADLAVEVSKRWFRTVPILFNTKTVADWAAGK